MKVQQSTVVATVGGALTVVVTYALQKWVDPTMPIAVATAATTLIMALLTHFVPDRA